MLVITNPVLIPNEIDTIHSLFENGLELLHVRKPEFSATEMKGFLLEIKSDFRQQLVLHSHHQLATEFGINRIHFTEKTRMEMTDESLKNWKEKRVYPLDFHSQNGCFRGIVRCFLITLFSDPFSRAFPNQIIIRILTSKKNWNTEQTTKQH